MDTSLTTARESFRLQASQVQANLVAHIQRTRQALSSGIVETAAVFMKPAYRKAAEDPGGTGIKRRMLDAITSHARQYAPSLFVTLRQELAEGVAVLRSSMSPQLSKIVQYGTSTLDLFRDNVGNHKIATPANRAAFVQALDRLPALKLIALEPV